MRVLIISDKPISCDMPADSVAEYAYETKLTPALYEIIKRFDSVIITPRCLRNELLELACKLKLHSSIFALDTDGAYAVCNTPNMRPVFGFRMNSELGREAYDEISLSESAIEKTARIAYELGDGLTVVLDDGLTGTSSLIRKAIAEINEDYPQIQTDVLNINEFFTSPRKSGRVYLSFYPTARSVLPALAPFDALAYVGDTDFALYCGEPESVLPFMDLCLKR